MGKGVVYDLAEDGLAGWAKVFQVQGSDFVWAGGFGVV